ncbi:hypothetical protein [Mycobacterium sp. OAE908]|uniref:hypothetical protein n=1 Tax=Mycobacterium sp. OAE908 TaxID=2817899 RepID=UPI001AE832A6
MTGIASCAVGATGAVTGVIAAASVLVVPGASSASAAVTDRDVVAVADGCSVTTLTAATDDVGEDGADAAVTAAVTAADFFEFASGSTGFDAGCSGSGAEVTGSSG